MRLVQKKKTYVNLQCALCDQNFQLEEDKAIWDTTEHICCLCNRTVCDDCISEQEQLDGEGCVCVGCGNKER